MIKWYALYYLICAILIVAGLFWADYDRQFLGMNDYPNQYQFMYTRYNN